MKVLAARNLDAMTWPCIEKINSGADFLAVQVGYRDDGASTRRRGR